MGATAIARNATRSMRIIALPLTPRRHPTNGRAIEHLVYYHFITPPAHSSTQKKPSWSKRAVAKASELWAGMGKAPESSWKRKAFLYGERLVDRLDFEELALKSLDPSLGPKLAVVPRDTSKLEPGTLPTIPLVFPPSACEAPIAHLRSLLERRAPKHRRGFWVWLAIAPLTAPFALIPVIPNFPFFFCIWRSWSHYRAYKASDYLSALMQRGAVVPQPSPALDAVYAKYAPAGNGKPPPSGPDRSLAPSDAALARAGKQNAPKPKQAKGQIEHEEHEEEEEDADADAETDATDGKGKGKGKEREREQGAGAALLVSREAVGELQDAVAAELPDAAASTFAADVYRALEQARLRLEGKRGAARAQ